MKHYKTMALCVAMIAMPTMTTAQTNIKRAFDKFTNSKSVNVAMNHSLTKDPETGLKEGQLDIYTFIVTKEREGMIKELVAAFEKDKEEAYGFYSGVNSDGNSGTELAVGGSTTGIGIAKGQGQSYVCALFSDPDDASRKHRYAYALDWGHKGDSITGRLVITYATTLKHRQKQQSMIFFGSGLNFNNDYNSNSDYDSGSWLGEFNIYLKKLKEKPDSSGASLYINQIYNLSKQAQSLTDSEKNLVTTEIHKIQNDITDDFQKILLSSAIENLKK